VTVQLIGLGRWGQKPLRVLGELGCEVWIADVSAERRAFVMKAGVSEACAVADFRAALPHVDVVDLVTPADTHLALESECLLAGKDCFVEKPLTVTVAEGRELAQVVQSTGRVLQVGHIFRFHPVTTFMRERIRSGSVGPVRHCTRRFAGFKRPRTDVGATQTDGLHYFDLFAHLLEKEPTAVTATLRDFLGHGMDDLGFCAAETHKVSGPEPLSHEITLLLDACAHRMAPAVDVEAGLVALRVVEAAHQSSRVGRRVLLSEMV